VVSHQRRETESGVRRVYRCQPVGDGQHHFFTVVETVAVPMPVWSPPPACEEHPEGHVVRDGRYASTTERRRQRYRCYPDRANKSDFHRFTPPLPRDHVHVGAEQCSACDELRGTHRGDPTVSRRQSWSARLVAESLRDLARGSTYAEVSKRVRERTKRTRTRNGATPRPDRVGRNSWHTAADWVETYSPVLWEYVETRLRAQAAEAVAERDRLAAAGVTNSQPLTLVIDDQPVFSKAVAETGRRVGRPSWFVLIAAQVRWLSRPGEIHRDQRLRLVRALPSNDHTAWKLVFDELDYTPDFVISDGDDAQRKAVREFYDGTVTLIPSMYHVRNNIELALLDSPGTYAKSSATAGKELRPELRDHLALLSRSNLTAMSEAEWTGWWDELEKLLLSMRAPLEPLRVRRGRYQDAVAEVLPLLSQLPQLPLSTGGLEVAIRRKVEPLLEGRAHAFANLERTNRLFDLVVCDDHGLFDHMPDVVKLLRDDSTANDGWGTPLREVADPQPPTAGRWSGRYSSLRDPLLLRDVARSRGIS
jgi:hypothetical protein